MCLNTPETSIERHYTDGLTTLIRSQKHSYQLFTDDPTFYETLKQQTKEFDPVFCVVNSKVKNFVLECPFEIIFILFCIVFRDQSNYVIK